MIRKSLLGFFLFLFFTGAHASYLSPFGFSISPLLVAKDPSNMRGYRLAIIAQPKRLNWEHVNIYFDGSYGHWWIPNGGPYANINSYSLAAYLRYYLIRKPIFSPYFEISIGPTYLSKTRIHDRNLGMHFCFQDQFTFGTAWFPDQHLYTSITVLHYSNGSFSNHNSGITVPLLFNLGYRF